ncbi:MAG TPA: radical SAM protein [Bryobacteraceae bacterium]|jgi:MoaA/NifB/PqqE/SkfB family radical SAM enzyme|nr:radical SAM protein [Bryobacteraceae bacterium]
MKKSDVLRVWGRVLRGQTPFLSIEITKECPLRCPGCYAYEPDHLGAFTTLRQLSDYRGQDLVTATVALVRRVRPVHLSIVGGEPLVRYRELCEILPRLDRMGVEVQLVTSAVRPIPEEWNSIGCLHVVVSVDGLAPEHDRRRAPATYDRILKHIAGQRIGVHCTVTRQMLERPWYLADFCRFWSDRSEVRQIWFSIYTPQEGDNSPERLRPEDREILFGELSAVAAEFPKVHLPQMVLEGYRKPPRSPEECTFARLTTCVSADLRTRIDPCQFGGKPVCAECGCLASAGMHALARMKLGGIFPLSAILNASIRLGSHGATAAPAQ